MKTTLDLPDDLMREIKIRAAREDRKLKDLITELLRQGMAAKERDGEARVRHRVQFPIISGGHPAKREEEITPERMKEILDEEDVERARRW
jgi:plasmid stability protein